MKLPLIGYSDKQVVDAQWNIITILTKGLTERSALTHPAVAPRGTLFRSQNAYTG